jgi:branched-chain amino acid transport system permease protein
MINFLQQVINGVSLGSIYALIALGYTMVYGVLRLINFAHGDVYMFGAFMGYYLTPYLTSKLAKLPIVSAVFAPGSLMFALLVMFGSMVICGFLGMVIERFAYRPGRSGSRFTMAFWLGLLGAVIGYYVYPSYAGLSAGVVAGAIIGVVLETTLVKSVQKASRLALLIIAIGMSLLLENGGQLVFGADPKFFPQIIPSQQLNVGALSINNQQIIVLVVGVALMILLNLIVHYTKTGKAMRAVSFNVDAAKLMGINTDRIIAFTFALGSSLAAAGGILVSLNYPKIDPLMGILTGLKAFVAAVLGGIGNITGAVIGGFIIGLAEVMVVGYGQSTYRDAIAFSLLILILLFRPAGIMGKGMVEKV